MASASASVSMFFRRELRRWRREFGRLLLRDVAQSLGVPRGVLPESGAAAAAVPAVPAAAAADDDEDDQEMLMMGGPMNPQRRGKRC